jgi:hypothetical protein
MSIGAMKVYKLKLSIGAMKVYKLKLRNLHSCHTLGWSWNNLTFDKTFVLFWWAYHAVSTVPYPGKVFGP